MKFLIFAVLALGSVSAFAEAESRSQAADETLNRIDSNEAPIRAAASSESPSADDVTSSIPPSDSNGSPNEQSSPSDPNAEGLR